MSETSRSQASALAFSAFSTTLFIFGLAMAGVLGDGGLTTIVPMGLFYGGLILLLAGMVSFKENDLFIATSALSYAGFWMAVALMLGMQHFFTVTGAEMGVFYLAWSVFTLYVWIASWKRGGAINLHYILWLIALILFFIAAFTDAKLLTTIGGWFAFASALVGWYVAAGKLFASSFGSTILRLGKDA